MRTPYACPTGFNQPKLERALLKGDIDRYGKTKTKKGLICVDHLDSNAYLRFSAETLKVELQKNFWLVSLLSYKGSESGIKLGSFNHRFLELHTGHNFNE